MKVLLIHRYFWPDTPPYASMLLAIAKQLVDDGHEVEVLTSQPSYKSGSETLAGKSSDVIDGVNIKRIQLFKEAGRSKFYKLLNMIYFPLRIIIYTLFNRNIDVVMSSTAPPVVTGFSSALSAKLIKAKFIYHCMDIHPEIGKISGEFKNPMIFKLLLKMDTWSCNNAEKVIVLSKDMEYSLLKRLGNIRNNINIINNFSLTDANSTNKVLLSKQYKKGKGKFRILFAGNIGRFQMLESFIDAMHLLVDLPQLELVFLGEGTALNLLKKRAGKKLGTSIKFFPHQDISSARMIMAESNLGIVSLLPDIYHYALPSKTMTYLAEGCPLLVTVEPESDLVKFITKHNIGIVGLPGDAKSIANAIRSALENKKFSKGMSDKCIQVSTDHYSEIDITSQWSTLYKELT